MALCTARFHNRLSGTVQTVHTVVGVATDDYETLINKPKINGVELSGDLTLEKLGYTGGAYFYTSKIAAGDSEKITFLKDDLRHFGKDVKYGSAVLTADKKLFVINSIGYNNGEYVYSAALFTDLATALTVEAEGDSIIITTSGG